MNHFIGLYFGLVGFIIVVSGLYFVTTLDGSIAVAVGVLTLAMAAMMIALGRLHIKDGNEDLKR